MSSENSHPLATWAAALIPPVRVSRPQDESQGTSLVLQWLKLRASKDAKGAWVQSLVRELRSHMPWGVAKKISFLSKTKKE